MAFYPIHDRVVQRGSLLCPFLSSAEDPPEPEQTLYYPPPPSNYSLEEQMRSMSVSTTHASSTASSNNQRAFSPPTPRRDPRQKPPRKRATNKSWSAKKIFRPKPDNPLPKDTELARSADAQKLTDLASVYQKSEKRARAEKTKVIQPVTSQSPMPRVYVAGFCRDEGSRKARSGFGCFWGIGHSLNTSDLVRAGPHNAIRAEFVAVLLAICRAGSHGIPAIRICTETPFVWMALEMHVHSWIRNGWVSALGRPIPNQDIIRRIVSRRTQVHVEFEVIQKTPIDFAMTQAMSFARNGARATR